MKAVAQILRFLQPYVKNIFMSILFTLTAVLCPSNSKNSQRDLHVSFYDL